MPATQQHHEETLREKAAKKLHGPDANPSQLGDPISLKAETSDRMPTEDQKGASTSAGDAGGSSSSRSSRQGRNNNGGHEKLREKAAKKLHGPDANPSQLGDPISLKAETSDRSPTEGERAAQKRSSKL